MASSVRAHTLTISPRLYLSLNQPIVNGTEEEEDDEEAQQPDASAVADEEETAEPQPPSKNKGKKGDKKKKDKKKGGKKEKAAAESGEGGGSGEMDPAFAFDEADDGVSALSRVLAGLVGWFLMVCLCLTPHRHGRHLGRARACAESFILTDPAFHHTPLPTVRREGLVGLPLRPR